MITESEYQDILNRCKELPKAKGMYLIDDYIENLLLTVLDFQMQNVSVEKAINYYRSKRQKEVRTIEDLANLLSKYQDAKEGNIAIAQYLWGNNHWTRISLLRRLVAFFKSEGITTQEKLVKWANTTSYKDFEGQVRGMGYAIYQWLIMRQGIETVKPDVHVRRFVESTINRTDTADNEIVACLEKVSRQLGLKAYELDWRIWEYQRSQKLE